MKKKSTIAIACVSLLILVGALSGCITDQGVKHTTVYDINVYYDEYKKGNVEVKGVLDTTDSDSRWILTDCDDPDYKIMFLYPEGFSDDDIGESITITGKVVGKRTFEGDRLPYIIHVRIE